MVRYTLDNLPICRTIEQAMTSLLLYGNARISMNDKCTAIAQPMETTQSTKGTEPMTTTTTITEVTERTAEDILKALNDDSYTTKNGGFLVGVGYNSLKLVKNPLRSCSFDGKKLTLNKATLVELSALISLVTADNEVDDAKYQTVDAMYRLNRKGE